MFDVFYYDHSGIAHCIKSFQNENNAFKFCSDRDFEITVNIGEYRELHIINTETGAIDEF